MQPITLVRLKSLQDNLLLVAIVASSLLFLYVLLSLKLLIVFVVFVVRYPLQIQVMVLLRNNVFLFARTAHRGDRKCIQRYAFYVNYTHLKDFQVSFWYDL
jgi:hypothetical protein